MEWWIWFAWLYSISGIQDYFEYIIGKHETIADNSPIEIYINKITNQVVFKVKTGYKLELLSKEAMKLLGSTKSVDQDVDQDKNSKNVPKLKMVDIILMHCNAVNDFCTSVINNVKNY